MCLSRSSPLRTTAASLRTAWKADMTSALGLPLSDGELFHLFVSLHWSRLAVRHSPLLYFIAFHSLDYSYTVTFGSQM